MSDPGAKTFSKRLDWRSIPGPWQAEPDREEWRHLGIVCLAARNVRHGNWCGYVAVPPGHPWHGQSYGQLEDVEIHGGLTYAAPCKGHICHVPQPGEPDDVWWLGFDCAHSDDLIPFLELERESEPFAPEYKTLAWVKAETERLAEQVALTA
jgi:hypothetical protein